MNVAELLKNTDKTLMSFELLPPLKGETIDAIYQTITPLIEFNPSYINVTYHREEVVYKKRSDGLLEQKTIRKRPGTVGISAAIMHKFNIEVVPHIICAGFNREETENALIDLHFLGINNLLVIRGDADKYSRQFISEPDGHSYSIDLLKQICDLNNGKYIDEDVKNIHPTNFSIGVAGYPEKHSESPNFEADLTNLKNKIDAGAEYIVTQMFFDNNKYFKFVEKCRNMGINVPIIPGLKPLSIKNHLNIIPNTFHVDIPEELAKEIRKTDDNKKINEIGIEWAIMQSKELKKLNVPSLHFYTMGKAENIYKIVKEVF